MARGDCRCGPEHLEVIQRRGNASAFNGYRWRPSAYSLVACRRCGAAWRSKARYIDALPDSHG